MRQGNIASMLLAAWAVVTVGATGARAVPAVGSITGVEGLAEIGRAEAWQQARLESSVAMQDALRTGDDGRLGLVFLDESLLNMGHDTTLIVDKTIYDSAASTSIFHLLKGKVRALVSDHYVDPLAHYQIETPNAVAGVRGTDFVVAYDPETETTEINCLGGQVLIRNKRVPGSGSVRCLPGTRIKIQRAELPSPALKISTDQVAKLKRALSYIGTPNVTTSSSQLRKALVASPLPKPYKVAIARNVKRVSATKVRQLLPRINRPKVAGALLGNAFRSIRKLPVATDP